MMNLYNNEPESEDDPTYDTIKYDKPYCQVTEGPYPEVPYPEGPYLSSQVNASLFNKDNCASQKKVAIIDSDNIKEVTAMNMLDQSISSYTEQPKYSVHDK